MNHQRLLFIFFMFLICTSHAASSYAASPAIEALFTELSQDNVEVKNTELQTQFNIETLHGSLSRLWPKLTLSATVNESADDAQSTPSSNLDSGAGTPGGSLGNQSSSTVTSLGSINRGWVTQASLGYFIFTGFSITEDIRRARHGVEAAEIKESITFDNKKAQLVQLILQWQLLQEVKHPIGQAAKMINEIKHFSKKQSSLLYTKADRIDLEEKINSIEYYRIKIQEGLNLVESAIQSLLPRMSRKRLNQLPSVQVAYQLPENNQVRNLYLTQSRQVISNELDIKSAQGYLRASEWQQAWIPTIYWSASYSYSGDYNNNTYDGGASTAIVASFNLFDGFYTQARTQQARVSVEATKNKQILEADKRVLLLKHNRMKALVAKAEYRMKASVADKKYLRYQDVQRKIQQGIGSRLDLSASSLDYVKARMEALDSLKEHQQAMLDIAVELNEWNKVDINEI